MNTPQRKNKTVWVIEDDQTYRQTLVKGLKARFEDANIVEFPTERAVYLEIDKVKGKSASPPDVALVDVALPYSFPGEESPPAEIQDLGRKAGLSAGTRLFEAVRASGIPSLQILPWIYHTALRRETIDFDRHSDANTSFTSKNETFAELVSKIGGIDEVWAESEEQETAMLLGATRMRNRLLGALAVPLDECFATIE
jgi:hypothetical protein